MKHIILIFLSELFMAPIMAQTGIYIENRNGQAVIVTRDTLPTGETRETVDWKADPTTVLTAQLKEANDRIEWIEGKIDRLRIELKQRKQEAKDVERALDDLAKGILEPSAPKESTPAPKSADPPPKKAKKKKG